MLVDIDVDVVVDEDELVGITIDIDVDVNFDVLVDINVDDQQVEDRIDDALQYYRDYHFDGTERIIKKIEITQTIKDNKQIDRTAAFFGKYAGGFWL